MKGTKRVYVFKARRPYGGGLFFQSATNKNSALKLAELGTHNLFDLTLLGTIGEFERMILKKEYLDFTWQE